MSKYIHNPLLVGGYKSHCRIYMIVTHTALSPASTACDRTIEKERDCNCAKECALDIALAVEAIARPRIKA